MTGGHKRPSEDTSPRSSPPPKQATEKMEESPPPHEASLPRGMMESDILPKRYEVFTSDFEWVQSIRGSLLGFEAGASPSRRDIELLRTSNGGVRDRASRGDNRALAAHSQEGRPPRGVPTEPVHHPGRLDPSVYP